MMQPDTSTRRVLAPHAPNAMTQKLWRSMRVLRHFTSTDLQVTAEASRTVCNRYVKALLKHGYLQHRGFKRIGTAKLRVLVLVKDTGPHAPRISTTGLTDLNTRQTFDGEGKEVAYLPRRTYRAVGGHALAREHGVTR